MDTDEHGSRVESGSAANNRERIDREFFYRVPWWSTIIIVVPGVFIIYVSIGNIFFADVHLSFIILGLSWCSIVLGWCLIAAGVYQLWQHVRDTQRAWRRIVFSVNELTVPRTPYSTKKRIIPYESIKRIILEKWNNRRFILIKYTRGRFPIDEATLVEKSDFQSILDELAARVPIEIESNRGRFQFTILFLLIVTAFVAVYLGMARYAFPDDNLEILRFLCMSLISLVPVFVFYSCYAYFQQRTARVFFCWFFCGLVVEWAATILISAFDLRIYPLSCVVMGLLYDKFGHDLFPWLCMPVIISGYLLTGTVFGAIGVIIYRLRLRRADAKID